MCSLSLALPCAAQPATPSSPQTGSADQTPHNPTQEIAGQRPEGNALDVGPAKLRIGGYLGLTGIYRSTNSGGGPATKFATTPYEDTLPGHLSQTRLSAESSRVSIRVDAEFPEGRTRFRAYSGYFEMDFSGTAPGNEAITTTSAGFRMRNAFGEARYRDSLFMSAGQAYSLMTPVKDQLSMWPSDFELSQAIDTNYLAGLVWGRYPQFRLMWRPSKTFNWAMSIENPEQQIGNGLVALPTCCANDLEAQYNTGSEQLDVANLMPDFHSRIAVNPGKALHLDAGGVIRVFRHTMAPYTSSFKEVGGGVSANANVKPTNTTRVIFQGAWGSGLGRYIGGLAPDVAFRADGSISPIGTVSWLTGVEQKISSRLSAAGYYSGISIDDNYTQEAGGRYIGFGFPGAPNSNNKRIHEATGTLSSQVMTTTNRGSAQVAVQLSRLEREPWFQGNGPESAKAFLFFAQVRYNLP